MSKNELKKLIEETRLWYKSIKKIYCDDIGAEILFNAKGFHHLLHDGLGNQRTPEECTRRLGLVRYVPDILKKAEQAIWRRKIGKTRYLSFRSTVLNKEGQSVWIRVVIRQTTRNYFYHSVMDEPIP